MVYGVIQNVKQALKMRGGWKGLLDHMYKVSSYCILLCKCFVNLAFDVYFTQLDFITLRMETTLLNLVLLWV